MTFLGINPKIGYEKVSHNKYVTGFNRLLSLII